MGEKFSEIYFFNILDQNMGDKLFFKTYIFNYIGEQI